MLSASARVCLAIETLAASGGSIITIWMLIEPSPAFPVLSCHVATSTESRAALLRYAEREPSGLGAAC